MPSSLESHRDSDIATLFFCNRHLLVLSILVLMIAGISALINMPRIEDPRITNRNPIILTVLPGASAARIEALVTKKLEDALREVSEIKDIESTSRPGISIISIELDDRIDRSNNQAVFSKIRDKLADAEHALPPGTMRPDFDDKRGAVAYSLIAAVRWNTNTAPRLGTVTRLAEELADRLRNLAGTEDVRLYGATEEEITVTADPAALAALGLSIADVSALIAAADAKKPAGVLRTNERDLLLEVEGELESIRRIADIPLASNGRGGVVKLGDVAAVKKNWLEPPRDIAYANGSRSVLVAARVETGVRIDQWAEAARELTAGYGQPMHEGVSVQVIFDQSRYTAERLSQLGGDLAAGSAVVLLVVLIGMGWRAALIVGAALPLSASFILFGLTFFGQQIHQMTIFGMIIAIGLLIDNAIVVTDEVRKRLRQALPPREAMAAAVRHLFNPLLASTLTTILGFMPIFLLPGNVGDFVSPIAMSVVLALIGSFLISMTIIAALAAFFTRPDEDAAPENWWQGGISNTALALSYRRTLVAALNRPLIAVCASLALPVAGLILAGTLGNQFFPLADREQFEVEVWLSNDASLERTARISREIEEVIRAHEGIVQVDWLVGGSYPSVYYNLIMNRDNNPSYAQAIVRGASADGVNALIPQLQAELDARFPQAKIVVSLFGQGPPYEAPVAFRLVGPNLAQLKDYGEQLRRIMYEQPAILHTHATISGGETKLWMKANEYEARIAGMTLSEIADQFQGSLEGRVGGSVLEDLEELPVRIRYGSRERGSLDRIGSINLVSREAAAQQLWIPAQAIGEFEIRPELASITRRNGERVNKILGWVPQGSLPIDITDAIIRRLEIDGFELPQGYRLEIAGDSEEQGRAIGQLMTFVPVLVALMIATLVLSFRSALLAVVIGTVALLSVGLGMLSLWMSGFPLGFNPILGSAGLVGVAINGTIVVLAAIRSNPQARRGDASAIVDEVLGSTRHIISTTLTTMGGFLPLLLLSGGSFWPPLAVVIAGGVGLSVILSLLYTPTVYHLLYRNRRPRHSGTGKLETVAAGKVVI